MPAQHNSPSALGRVLKYTGIFGGVQGFYVLMSVVRSKITAELLSTRGVGLIGNFNRAVDFIGAATGLGLSFSAVQRISRLAERGNERATAHYVCLVRSWILIAALVGLLVMAAGAPLWSYFYFETTAYTPHFLLLAPLVALTTLSGGELAVLKGLRRIKSMALISTLSTLSTLTLTTLLYGQWGVAAIVPALLLCTAVLFGLQLRTTHRLVPYAVRITSWRFLRKGRLMLRLGMAYALSNFIAFGTESAVRALILRHPEAAGLPLLTGTEAVGIYGTGLTLVVTYSRLIFMSMDAEYYPRLSALTHRIALQNEAVNRQIDVLVLLISPFLLAFALCLPYLIPLLYTPAFLPVVPMVMGALLALFFKAVVTPIAYLSLAHARSRLYLGLELTYSAVSLLLLAGGYLQFGFSGAGWGLTLSYLIYLFVVYFNCRRAFGFAFERTTLRRALSQLLLVLPTLLAMAFLSSWARAAVGTVFLLGSLALSWQLLRHAVHLPARLHRLFHRSED